MANSRSLAAGGLVSTLVIGVLTNVLSDKLSFLWRSPDAATPTQHSASAVERPFAEQSDSARAPRANNVPPLQPRPSAEPPSRGQPKNNIHDKNIRDKSTTIDDDDGGE